MENLQVGMAIIDLEEYRDLIESNTTLINSYDKKIDEYNYLYNAVTKYIYEEYYSNISDIVTNNSEWDRDKVRTKINKFFVSDFTIETVYTELIEKYKKEHEESEETK